MSYSSIATVLLHAQPSQCQAPQVEMSLDFSIRISACQFWLPSAGQCLSVIEHEDFVYGIPAGSEMRYS